MAARSSLECIGIGRRFFHDAQRTGARQNNDGAKLGGCRLVRCSANRRSASTICVCQARTAENEGERPGKMSGRASVIAKERGRPGSRVGAERPRGRRADRPRIGSLPPPNRHVREMRDSSNRKLPFCGFQQANCFHFSTGWHRPAVLHDPIDARRRMPADMTTGQGPRPGAHP